MHPLQLTSFHTPWVNVLRSMQTAHRGLKRSFDPEADDGIFLNDDLIGLLHDIPLQVIIISLFVLCVIASKVYIQWRRQVKLPYVTVGGGPHWIRSWRTSIHWVANSKSLIDQGYYEHRHKTKIGAYQIPTIGGTYVVICAKDLIEEFRNAPSNKLSFAHATSDILQAEFTLGTNILFNPYHVPIVREQLTRQMDAFSVPLMEEFAFAMEYYMDLNGGEWKTFKAYELCADILAQGMSRVFVGPELCRNPEYLKLAIGFTQEVFVNAHILHLVPTPMRYILSPLLNAFTINKSLRAAIRLLGPMIEERKRRANEEGRNWKGRPEDLLQWVIEGAPPGEQNLKAHVKRLMELNMAGLHTTVNTLYQALFWLVMYPEYIPELRQEMESVIGEFGWNKASFSKMLKLDSFMKESHRLHGPSVAIMGRKVLGDGFTFSNGLYLPPGVTVGVPETIHRDEVEYGPNAKEFDGFRFSRPVEDAAAGVNGEKEESGSSRVKRKYFVTTSLNYLRFGHGHGSCPGRFYAAHELKILICLFLMNYDLRLEDVPKPIYFLIHRVPDMSARISIRRRKTASF
ncbi:cytochrome P450 [Kalaharituber pfeilii]|nr:cytochrome P450 [Kalaharituber pfeilii]